MSNAVFIRAEELAQELEISKAKAYKMIRQWNDELRAKGYATVNGRVSRQYYKEHMYALESAPASRRSCWFALLTAWPQAMKEQPCRPTEASYRLSRLSRSSRLSKENSCSIRSADGIYSLHNA